ncbi:hypothetical protein SVAN01_04897 [Stagonosporopsis vannaccii]|nr:hypothetical protein SVAN01_04897 [Stagonosporopsis vannaccii]
MWYQLLVSDHEPSLTSVQPSRWLDVIVCTPVTVHGRVASILTSPRDVTVWVPMRSLRKLCKEGTYSIYPTLLYVQLLDSTMPEVKIKEESEESPLPAIPLQCSRTKATLLTTSPDGCESREDADLAQKKPLLQVKSSNDPHNARNQHPLVKAKWESTDVAAAGPALAMHREITPQIYRLRGARHTNGCLGTRAPPVAAWLSSRPSSALATQQQTAALSTTRPHNHFLANNNNTQSQRALLTPCTTRTLTRAVVRTGTMDSFNLDGNDALGYHGGLSFDAPDNFTGALGHEPQTVTVLLSDWQNQQAQLRQLQSTIERLERLESLEKQNTVMTGLVSSNHHNMQSTMVSLTARVDQLERVTFAGQTAGTRPRLALPSAAAGNPAFDTDALDSAIAKTPRKRSFTNAVNTDGASMSAPSKYRKKLQVEIPANATAKASAVGLPTPMLSAYQTMPASALFGISSPATPGTPHTPYTNGRIGPPDSYKKSATAVTKREIHNLNTFIPPHNVQLPQVPLTDLEIVVYFFNSLTRPIVSLRLYARGWAPNSISQTLNAYRDVEPPYLRNTCSVKCTGAIKNGKKWYGENWEAEHRPIFENATDELATDLIRTGEDEPVDYYIRALGVRLKQYPFDDGAGIFTDCVKYCIETGAPYTVSNVHKLAFDLHHGNVPQHPASPNPSDVASPPKIAGEADKDAEWSEDDGPASPTPLAARKPRSVGFTAVNALTDAYGKADK